MNEQIIALAREAFGADHEIFWFEDDGLEKFAALVAAHEREACAKVCEEYETANDITATWQNIIAEQIRNRGTA